MSARYRYHAGGRDYIGTRVGLHSGSDNIGTWHRRTADRLQAAGRTITVFVDPDDHTGSVIDPQPRVELLLFTLVFAMVFSGVGATAMWFARRDRRSKALGVRGADPGFDVAFDLPITMLADYETVSGLQLHRTLTVRSRRPHITREFRAEIVTPAMLHDAQGSEEKSEIRKSGQSAAAGRPVIVRR